MKYREESVTQANLRMTNESVQYYIPLFLLIRVGKLVHDAKNRRKYEVLTTIIPSYSVRSSSY